jgi:hypothetical protein
MDERNNEAETKPAGGEEAGVTGGMSGGGDANRGSTGEGSQANKAGQIERETNDE